MIRLHDARHGCPTLLTPAGVAPRVVMEILWHSQIAGRMNVYTHVVQDPLPTDLRDALAQIT